MKSIGPSERVRLSFTAPLDKSKITPFQHGLESIVCFVDKLFRRAVHPTNWLARIHLAEHKLCLLVLFRDDLIHVGNNRRRRGEKCRVQSSKKCHRGPEVSKLNRTYLERTEASISGFAGTNNLPQKSIVFCPSTCHSAGCHCNKSGERTCSSSSDRVFPTSAVPWMTGKHGCIRACSRETWAAPTRSENIKCTVKVVLVDITHHGRSLVTNLLVCSQHNEQESGQRI